MEIAQLYLVIFDYSMRFLLFFFQRLIYYVYVGTKFLIRYVFYNVLN